MLSKYPQNIDIFETKVDAVSPTDPNGDFVMADDVNHLQDAVVAIQRSLGSNPQGEYSTVGERLVATSITSMNVPSLLIYLGAPSQINESKTVAEAAEHFVKYDHVVFGGGVENPLHPDHQATLEIMSRARASRSINFYGYIDCGVTTSNLSLGEIQVRINQWNDMGVVGIFLDNFGYDREVSRERQNDILDSVHQYDLTAIIEASNPDDVFSDTQHPQLNPDWTPPQVSDQDIYHFSGFAVNTIDGGYQFHGPLLSKLEKLYNYRSQIGIRIFGTATISSSVSSDEAQKYYEYAHAMAMLASIDAFGSTNEDRFININKVRDYGFYSFIGRWYSKHPQIENVEGVLTRKTSFGEITVNTNNQNYTIQGLMIPSSVLIPIPNSVDGDFLKDYSVDDRKIKNYNGQRLISAINEDETSTINLNKVTSLIDSSGGISEGLIQTNVLQALNASIGQLEAGTAAIGALTASEITTGKLVAERISSSVVAAINLYAAEMEADSVRINSAVIGELEAEHIRASVIEAINFEGQAANIENINADNITTGDIAADRMRANVVSAINLYAEELEVEDARISNAVIGVLDARNIGAQSITAEKLHAEALTADLMAGKVVEAINLSANNAVINYINGDRIRARSITAEQIASNSITAEEIQVGAIGANQIAAGSITSEHISSVGLDAHIINVHNSETGQVLIGGGYVLVDGLDVGVVQSDNLVVNGLFLTASSGFGFLRDNPAGEVILGSQTEAQGGHDVWKIDTQSGLVSAVIDIPGKKPYGIAIDRNEKYAYVTVQGNNTIAQVDLINNVVTSNFLKSGKGPGVIKFTGGHLADMKHLFALSTDSEDVNIPDSLMVIDGPPTSTNMALYMHHEIPLGNMPFDFVMDDNHLTYITMADQGDIIVVDTSTRTSMDWKVAGRIPITAYGTDNYHGGLPGEFGLGEVVGGSAAIGYQEDMGHHGGMHHHGGYGSADGSLKKYKPRGIALSTDQDTLYVVDYENNELVVVDKHGNAPYNVTTGTRERANHGEWGQPKPEFLPPQGQKGEGNSHYYAHSVEPMFGAQTIPTGPSPFPPELIEDPTPISSGERDYTNQNGETKYVRYRIPVGDSPEFIVNHNGKIFITLSGGNQIAVIDEQEILDAIQHDKGIYYNEYAEFPPWHHFNVRYIRIGSMPSHMCVDEVNNKLYVTINGQNQVAKIDIATETIEARYNVGANPQGLALTADGSSLYVVNHGGSGNISFVYPEGAYFGDAYLGLEGEVSHHGAHGWMPNRSDWVYDSEGKIVSSSTVEFRINEPFLNEGGYTRLSMQGIHSQWASIEQDVLNVTNYSDGTSPSGTWFKNHNASAQIAIASGSSPNFITKFEVDEYVPKFVVFDNQQTEPFTPIEDGINEEYEGQYYSVMTNRAHNGTVTASADPIEGDLETIIDDVEPIQEGKEDEDYHMHVHSVDEPEIIDLDQFQAMNHIEKDPGEYVELPDGLQSITIDLGKAYMIGKIVVIHEFAKERIYHGTKTEISEDGVNWITVFDSAVDGEYKEYEIHDLGEDKTYTEYGKHIIFNAKRVRYVRDWANGCTEYDENWQNPVERGTNRWTEIKVFGDWEVETGYVYPENSDKAGQPLATNGYCFVSTNIPKAYIALDIPIEFTSWSWITYIAGPQYGTMRVEMPSLMHSTHFVDQNWPYLTNIAHKHIMTFPPSVNVKENESMGVKAGKHRMVLRQERGRVTLDRQKFEDYQKYNPSGNPNQPTNSTIVEPETASYFRRAKIVPTQAQGYVGKGAQSTEGAYDEPRRNPDTGLPDGSVPIKYRIRILSQLNPTGEEEERGIAFATSVIMEAGKQYTHWRMSQSGDLFPGTRIESWDPSQPHKTGIQNHHLANGSVRGSKLMPNSIMNHHISPYARIGEFKLDLNYPTHPHHNKEILDSIEGLGLDPIDDIEPPHSGTSNRVARADHTHPEIIQASHSHSNKDILDTITEDHIHLHPNKDILDLFGVDSENKLTWDGELVGAGGGSGGGGLTDGSVRTKHIRLVNGSISLDPGDGIITEQVRDGAITNLKLANGIDGAKLASTSIININNGSITAGTVNGGSGSTFTGTLYLGNTTNTSGDLIIRNTSGANAIHLDGDSSGKVSQTNTRSYIAGNGDAEFLGTLRAGTLRVNTSTLVPNLNAEYLNGKKEIEFAKNESFRDQSGYGVLKGLEVQALPVPSMSVVVKAGTAYLTNGRRIAYPDTTIALQNASQNFDRLDVIYIMGPSAGANEGNLSVETGTPAADPVEKSIPADAIKLAVVLVKRNIGAITDGFNRGSNTPDGSPDYITDARVWRPIRYVEASNSYVVEPRIEAPRNTAVLTIPAGETRVVWNHNHGSTNYVAVATPDSPNRHVYYENKEEDSIHFCIDDPTDIDIILMIIMFGY